MFYPVTEFSGLSDFTELLQVNCWYTVGVSSRVCSDPRDGGHAFLSDSSRAFFQITFFFGKYIFSAFSISWKNM